MRQKVVRLHPRGFVPELLAAEWLDDAIRHANTVGFSVESSIVYGSEFDCSIRLASPFDGHLEFLAILDKVA